jgi:hypothetical protein
LGTGQLENVEGFELTFAIIGVGVTVFAIVSTGGTALAPMKAGLTSFKNALRLLWGDIGGAMLSKGLVSSSKYMWQNIKMFASGERTLARQQMKDFSIAMGEIISSSLLRVKSFFLLVKSVDDLRILIKVAKRSNSNACPVASVQSSEWLYFVFKFSYAAPDCFNEFKYLLDIAENKTRYGKHAPDVAKALLSVSDHKYLNGFEMDPRAGTVYMGLAEVAFQHIKRQKTSDAIDKFPDRLNKALDKFSKDDVFDTFEVAYSISTNEKLMENGGSGFISRLLTSQDGQNDPVGGVLTAKIIKNKGIEKVVGFEINLSGFSKKHEVVPPFPYKTRRQDVAIEDEDGVYLLYEVKGSDKDVGGIYKLESEHRIEFMNDVIYYCLAEQRFQWHIAPQLDFSKAKSSMKRILGGGESIDELNNVDEVGEYILPPKIHPKLNSYYNDLADDDKKALFLKQLSVLYKELSSGKIIKSAEVG